MLYGYDLTLEQMSQIRNFKKKNKFDSKLCSIKNIELSTFEAYVNILFKQTVPLNLFEKYSLKIIQKANEIYSTINIKKIADLLHLDENIIRENLKNLAQIDMINGLDSNNVTINFDENAEYLQYENKFKKEKIQENLYLTKDEFKDIYNFVKNNFEKNIKENDKKFLNFELIGSKESTKKVKLLTYSDKKFLIYSNQGINNHNDLKFLDNQIYENLSNQTFIQNENFFCHKEEFLPILRDKISLNKDNSIVVVFSTKIEDTAHEIIKLNKNQKNLYIFTNYTNDKEKRIFFIDITLDDIFIFGNEYYIRKNDSIYEINNLEDKKNIKEILSNYFLEKIIMVEPNYDKNTLDEINIQIEEIEKSMNNLTFKDKKDFDKEMQKIKEAKNKLYGIDLNDSKKRVSVRKRIDEFEKINNEKQLEKYPIYLENRTKIFELAKELENYEKQKENLETLQRELNILNQKKSSLISKENKEEIIQFENELKNINRMKIY